MKESENRRTKDRRVSRTLKKIREAYLELAKEKNPAKITVSELAAAAGINRKTFYMYYSGTEELLGEIADDLLEKYRELISGVELYSGSFEPLKEVVPGKKVVLGLITTKRPELEDREQVIARIREAARYVPLENLCLSPQCGFASCEIGNRLTEEQQWAKLALVRSIVQEVWGE